RGRSPAGPPSLETEATVASAATAGLHLVAADRFGPGVVVGQVDAPAQEVHGRPLGGAVAAHVAHGDGEVLPAGVDDVEDPGQGGFRQVPAAGREDHPGGEDVGHEGEVGLVAAALDREVDGEAQP